jgi:NTE family protein
MRPTTSRTRRAIATWLAIVGMLACSTPALPAAEPGRPRIGLVLAGGGAKGGAHVGVLKVL